MANELTVTKEQTARFVNDAMEMETAAFTLERAMEECEGKKKQLLDSAQEKVDVAKRELDRAENNYNTKEQKRAELAQKHIPTVSYMDDEGSIFILMAQGLLATAAFFGIIGIIIYVIALCTGEYFEDIALPFILSIAFFIVPIVLITLLGLINSLIIKKEHKRKLIQEAEIVASAFEPLQNAQSDHSLALTDQSQAQMAAELLDAQIAKLQRERDTIRTNLASFYAFDVIKPKYRNIECAVIMNELFENDRVDTMREAMDKCEERLFRNEMLQGIQNIHTILGKLAIGLAEISGKLDSINSNVKMMSQDLYTFSERIAQGQSMQLHATEDLVRETELSRYATERVAASTAYLEWNQRNINYKYNL